MPFASPLPLAVVVLAQFLVSFNLSALAVCVGEIGDTFDAPATSVGAAIVTHSSLIAGLVLIGAKVGETFGSRSVFRTMVMLFGIAMVVAAISPGPGTMILAESMAGAAAAALLPTLVVLIGTHYHGVQQARALAWLAASQAIATAVALLVAGAIGTWLGWRYAFALLALLAGVVFLLSRRLRPVERVVRKGFDGVGLVLGGASIALVIGGINALADWGVVAAQPAAPIAPFGVSPALLLIAAGLSCGWAFIVWERRCHARAQAALVSAEVMSNPQERCALIALFIIVALGAAVRYLVPLYIEVVQGETSLDAARTVVPYSLAVFVAAISVVMLYDYAAPRSIARAAFLIVAFGLAALGLAVHNDWSEGTVIGALAAIGFAEGMLLTLLLNVLVSAAPGAKAADVGSLRSTVSSCGGALGTAVSGALLIGFLNGSFGRDEAPYLPPWGELRAQLDLDSVRFVSNDRLLPLLESSAIGAEQVEAALQMNTEARLQALRASLLALAAIAVIGALPAGRLARHRRGHKALEHRRTSPWIHRR